MFRRNQTPDLSYQQHRSTTQPHELQLWHACLHQRITLCQICRIVYFNFCNWYNIIMCPCFHCHHQWIYWRRILPKSKLSQWLCSNGIWCNTIDSRWGAKFIYNEDQHANTYVSLWGLFPVGKYGHAILPSNLDLTSNNKASLHQTFWNSLIEFLHTDLDGNLTSP